MTLPLQTTERGGGRSLGQLSAYWPAAEMAAGTRMSRARS